MAAGRPVLGTAVGGIPYLVGSGAEAAGWVVEPSGLADALPIARVIYIEPDIYRPDGASSATSVSAAAPPAPRARCGRVRNGHPRRTPTRVGPTRRPREPTLPGNRGRGGDKSAVALQALQKQARHI